MSLGFLEDEFVKYTIKKVARAIVGTFITVLPTLQVVLSHYGITISVDQVILTAGIASLLAGALEYLRNHLKHKAGIKQL